MGHNCSLYRHYCKSCQRMKDIFVRIRVILANATFNNISVIYINFIGGQAIKETRVTKKNQRPVASHWQTFFGTQTDSLIRYLEIGDFALLYKTITVVSTDTLC
jgi:hypothetical protein